MNYYEARQTKDGTGWHFTCQNGADVWAVGNCREHPPHATREEAEECYCDAVLESLETFQRDPKHLLICAECKQPTHRFATTKDAGFAQRIPLCAIHNTRAIYAKHFEFSPVFVSSY